MQIIRRHAAEITTAVVVASVFSMYSTASVGRLLGLLPSLTSAIIPHCVTVALALPIASLLEGQFYMTFPSTWSCRNRNTLPVLHDSRDETVGRMLSLYNDSLLT